MDLRTVQDQMGFMVQVPPKPRRIVSLVPSITEYLHDLGLEDYLVGITKFCVHPPHYLQTKTRVGGTKNFKVELIRSLHPDLIVANKEENEKEKLLHLKNAGLPVWISDVTDYNSALDMMLRLGDVCGVPETAQSLVKDVQKARKWLKTPESKIPVAYLIWRRPFMTVNRNTFIHHMMAMAGMENVFAGHEARYPEISTEDLQAASPSLVILSSEPYPFSEKHFEELEKIVPQAYLFLADGEMFSWYGSRMLQAFDYLEMVRKQVVEPIRTAWARESK
ncbi:MAG: helical backbone metal receptor [Flavobacteriales bacterium]|nr:helical backbone metal receptor [Flavobacteriales bacterium]MCX7650785.1 helical backbone metal receptor [Flavobacteriales bacterium]MDW8431581.1 helical backbone metal receptor [Flavobacteriales bacterium]